MQLRIKMTPMPEYDLKLLKAISQSTDLAMMGNMDVTIWKKPENDQVFVIPSNESVATLPSGCKMHGKSIPGGKFYTAQYCAGES